jgi:hypothetical protein
MKLEANITRFAPRDGYICDVDKHRKATEEDYDFRFISPGYYLCATEEGNAYTISEYKGKIGCACADMTFNCKGKEVCKHLIAFMNLKDLPDKDISEDQTQLLKAAGWAGKKLSPPDRPEQRKKTKLPSVHDPDRKPTKQASTRYEGMTPAEIIAEMPPDELERNARRGSALARIEVERRQAARAGSA